MDVIFYTHDFMDKQALKRVKYLMELHFIDRSIEYLSKSSMKHQVVPRYAPKCIDTAHDDGPRINLSASCTRSTHYEINSVQGRIKLRQWLHQSLVQIEKTLSSRHGLFRFGSNATQILFVIRSYCFRWEERWKWAKKVSFDDLFTHIVDECLERDLQRISFVPHELNCCFGTL